MLERDQLPPPATRADVMRSVDLDFPSSQGAGVLALLDRYSEELHERERNRVQMAILKLSQGRLDQLQEEVRKAKLDYRDTLVAAEYSESFAYVLPPRRNSDPEVPVSVGLEGSCQYQREQYWYGRGRRKVPVNAARSPIFATPGSQPKETIARVGKSHSDSFRCPAEGPSRCSSSMWLRDDCAFSVRIAPPGYHHCMARSRLNEGSPIDPLESNQEPYVHIIAPNIDHISRASFRRGSLSLRRIIRGLVVLGVAVGVMALVAAIGAVFVLLH